MKAAVLYEYGKPMVIEEVELDPPKSGEIHVKVAAAGICRSDLHVMKGDALQPLPVVLGHEGAGIVLGIGEGVVSFKPGDRVIIPFVSSCGKCVSCLTGRGNLCDTHGATAGFMFDGTTRLHKNDHRIHHMSKLACFAQEAIVPDISCVIVPDDVPMAQAALIGCCVTTGIGATTHTTKVAPGNTVAVIGCGGVGINVIQGAHLQNASKIIAIDINEGALEFAMGFGATHAINSNQEDPIQCAKDITGGLGVDYAFEVFGSTKTVKNAFDIVRKGGTAVIVGLAPVNEVAGIDVVSLVRQEKTLKGSYYGSTRPSIDIPNMIDMYRSGKINIDDLITREYSLDDINEAYSDLEHGEIGRGVITTF